MPCLGESQLQLRNFGLNYDHPEDFVEPQFGGPALWYVVYRIMMSMYFCTMTGYSILTFESYVKWFLFQSHWSYMIITTSTVLQAVCVTRHYDIWRRHGYDWECEKMQLPFKVIWVLQNIIYSPAPVITILYWNLFYRGNTLHLGNTNTHIANSIYVALEICITAIPMRLLHVYHVILYAVLYVAFTCIYWKAGGTGMREEPYVYEIFDYNSKPLTATICFLAVIVVGVMLHICACALVFLRGVLCIRCRLRNAVEPCCDAGPALEPV